MLCKEDLVFFASDYLFVTLFLNKVSHQKPVLRAKEKPQALPKLKLRKPEKGGRGEVVSNLSVISAQHAKSQKKVYHSNGQVKIQASCFPPPLSHLRGSPARFYLGNGTALRC